MLRECKSVEYVEILRQMDEVLGLIIKACGTHLAEKTESRPVIVTRLEKVGCTFALVAIPDEPGDSLTESEKRVALLVGHGLGNKGIAKHLKRSQETVAHHVHNILAKCDFQTRAQLARYAALALQPPLIK